MMNKQTSSTFSRDRSYQFLKKVGSGAYGKVFCAKSHLTGDKVAIKEIFDLRDVLDSIKLVRELQMLKHFNTDNHPNIIQLTDAYIKVTPRYGNHVKLPKHAFDKVYVVTEYLETDLHKLIHRYRIKTSDNTLTESHYHYFAAQLVSGLYYLRTAGIIHRDLKPSNIVLNSDCSLKIIDFGLSISEDDKTGKHNKAKTDYVVTRWYRAPEVILYNPHKEYDYQIDVWSLGCIMAEMVLKRPLFDGDDPKDQLRKILQFIDLSDDDFKYLTSLNNTKKVADFINYYKRANSTKSFTERFIELYHTCFKEDNGPDKNPEILNTELIELIEKMLIINPNERITIEELVEDPYFKNVFKNSESEEEKGYIPIKRASKVFKLDYGIETELIESENINNVKEHIYAQVYTEPDINMDELCNDLKSLCE